jgi:hypothetical protein
MPRQTTHIHVATLNRALNRFGTDLPSTRAPGPYLDNDYLLVLETSGEEKAAHVFYKNAIEFYRPKIVG